MVQDQLQKSIWFSASTLIGCVMAFSVVQGLTYPLLALILKNSGSSSSAIGLSAAMTPLGIICSAPFLSRYGNRFDRIYFLIGTIASTIVFLLLIGLFQYRWVWLLLRLLLGCSVNAIYVLSETTLLEIAPATHRGRIIGAYTSMTTLGYAAGPIILTAVNYEGLAPFIITAILLSVAMIPLFLVPIGKHQAAASSPGPSSPGQGSMLSFLGVAWILVFAYAATTLFDNAFMSLLPIYGINNGLREGTITLLLSIILMGGVAAQIPLGWLVDRISIIPITLSCCVAGTLGFLLFPIALGAFIPAASIAFVWGAAVLGVQTITLSELGRRFSGSMLVAGNATFAMMWGVSGIVGIPASGAAMDIMGPNGLLFIVGGVYFASTAVFLIDIIRSV